MEHLAPNKQQVEGLKFVADCMTLDDFTDSIIVLRRSNFMTQATAELIMSRFRLIKQGLI